MNGRLAISLGRPRRVFSRLRTDRDLAVRVLLGSLTGLLGLYIAHISFGLGGARLGTVFDKGVYNVLLFGSAGACLARALLVRRERSAWLVLGIGLVLWASGDLYWTLFLFDAEPAPFPSVADALWLAFYPACYTAIVLLLRDRTREFHASLWLDGLIGGLTVASIAAAAVFGVVLESTGGSVLAVATNLAYPLADMLLLGLIVAALALSGWRLERNWLFMAAACVVMGVADSVFLYQAAVGSYVEGTLVDAGWTVSTVLFAYAAAQRSEQQKPIQLEGWRLFAMPALFGFTGLLVLVYDHFRPVTTLALVLATGAVGAVIVRMGLTFHENVRLLSASRKEALTDSLTSLGNRRRLMLDLEHELARATEASPLVLTLLDLDGFKRYNDTYGHPAGDALLRRLARNLAASTGGRGSAYRLGGDEFCVLAPVGEEGPDGMAAGAAWALREQGEGFTITSSPGSVLLPGEAATPSEALRLADIRMYASKRRRSPSAGRQSKDVLLRLLHERDPELGHHLSGVAQLAEAVARKLTLPDEEVEQLRQAGELHDVGKLGIPDTILAKPGPLTEEEWAFVRRHTLVGERILAAAPSLAEVAALVRSTHERFDGRGYPDRLAGEEIARGARIIAVCDAFQAMTSPRPYRSPLTTESALAELRRCAGSQFDPVVVEAFTSAYAELRAPLVA